MRYTLLLILISAVLFGCNPSGVDEQKNDEQVDLKQSDSLQTNILDTEQSIVDELKLEDGLVIRWFKHGSGEKLKQGDFVNIDYKVLLKDGKVVDGNHLLKKDKMPFMVGFEMQTKGWDIALKELKVGDFAEVYIPSSLARGEAGIKDLIPPNSDNILKIRVIERVKPTREIDGNKVWVFEENLKNKEVFNEENEVHFHCMTSSPTNPMYVNTYRNNSPFVMKLEDQGMVPGIKKALINAKKSDRMFVFVPASEAYGSKGYLDVVKPNEDLFFNILVMDVKKK